MTETNTGIIVVDGIKDLSVYSQPHAYTSRWLTIVVETDNQRSSLLIYELYLNITSQLVCDRAIL